MTIHVRYLFLVTHVVELLAVLVSCEITFAAKSKCFLFTPVNSNVFPILLKSSINGGSPYLYTLYSSLNAYKCLASALQVALGNSKIRIPKMKK